jgi:hypothetical protein
MATGQNPGALVFKTAGSYGCSSPFIRPQNSQISYEQLMTSRVSNCRSMIFRYIQHAQSGEVNDRSMPAARPVKTLCSVGIIGAASGTIEGPGFCIQPATATLRGWICFHGVPAKITSCLNSFWKIDPNHNIHNINN